MSSADLTAGTVMDHAASLMNDTAKTVYTYTALLPYVDMALQELREHFELNAIPMTEGVSAVINVPSGMTEIVYNAAPGTPRLPDDMVEPNQLFESQAGNNAFVPMIRKDYLPHYSAGDRSQFGIFAWQGQMIKLMPCNRSNDIKIDYIRELFAPITGAGSQINVVNAATFLEYRTAGLLAEFIERNIESANALNAYAVLALDRVTGIGVRSKQSIMTRRRPFRAAYKRRTT